MNHLLVHLNQRLLAVVVGTVVSVVSVVGVVVKGVVVVAVEAVAVETRIKEE